MSASTSSSLVVSGSGFYPMGSMLLTFRTDDGVNTTYSATADSLGSIIDSISCSTINGILTASYVDLFATDSTYGVQSNTVRVAVNQTTNPTITITQPTVQGGSYLFNGSWFTPSGLINIMVISYSGATPINGGSWHANSSGAIVNAQMGTHSGVRFFLVDVATGRNSNTVTA